jgi:hypothetical protein
LGEIFLDDACQTFPEIGGALVRLADIAARDGENQGCKLKLAERPANARIDQQGESGRRQLPLTEGTGSPFRLLNKLRTRRQDASGLVVKADENGHGAGGCLELFFDVGYVPRRLGDQIAPRVHIVVDDAFAARRRLVGRAPAGAVVCLFDELGLEQLADAVLDIGEVVSIQETGDVRDAFRATEGMDDVQYRVVLAAEGLIVGSDSDALPVETVERLTQAHQGMFEIGHRFFQTVLTEMPVFQIWS